jgi:exodeoxyribonuclease VII large subunit
MHHFFTSARKRYDDAIRDPAFKRILYRISESRMQCAMVHERAVRAVSYGLKNFRALLSRNAAKLNALSPLAVLSRGFSVVSKPDGAVVSDVRQINAGQNIHLRFHKGGADAEVISTDNG